MPSVVVKDAVAMQSKLARSRRLAAMRARFWRSVPCQSVPRSTLSSIAAVADSIGGLAQFFNSDVALHDTAIKTMAGSLS